MNTRSIFVSLLGLAILTGAFLSMTGCYCTYDGANGCLYQPDKVSTPAPLHR